jgi:succinate dehydrogenase / fumarate reductase cytochrome b subunit
MVIHTRPLSPHLQVYRWYVSMFTSIVHRVTGLAAGVGALLLVWWLLALAAGPDAFATTQAIFSAWYGRLVLFGITWALFFHLLNGIRHLFWDMGHGFELKTAHNSGVLVIVLSAILTVILWIYGYWSLGAWT